MSMNEQVEAIQSRKALVSFVRSLYDDLKKKPETWGNKNLDSYLEAIAAWIEDMDGYYLNLNEPVPEEPSWKTIGQILLAAKLYE
jgi:hypothetical protein